MSTKKANATEDTIISKDMRNQNHPSTVQNLDDALQSDNIKKSGVERSLAAPVEKGSVTLKQYGKSKLFLQCQAKIQLPDEEETADEEADLAALLKLVEETDAKLEDLRNIIDTVSEAMNKKDE